MTIVIGAAIASPGSKGAEAGEGSPVALLTSGIQRHRIDRLTDERRYRHPPGVGRPAQALGLLEGQLDLRTHHAHMIARPGVMLLRSIGRTLYDRQSLRECRASRGRDIPAEAGWTWRSEPGDRYDGTKLGDPAIQGGRWAPSVSTPVREGGCPRHHMFALRRWRSLMDENQNRGALATMGILSIPVIRHRRPRPSRRRSAAIWIWSPSRAWRPRPAPSPTWRTPRPSCAVSIAGDLAPIEGGLPRPRRSGWPTSGRPMRPSCPGFSNSSERAWWSPAGRSRRS